MLLLFCIARLSGTQSRAVAKMEWERKSRGERGQREKKQQRENIRIRNITYVFKTFEVIMKSILQSSLYDLYALLACCDSIYEKNPSFIADISIFLHYFFGIGSLSLSCFLFSPHIHTPTNAKLTCRMPTVIFTMQNLSSQRHYVSVTLPPISDFFSKIHQSKFENLKIVDILQNNGLILILFKLKSSNCNFLIRIFHNYFSNFEILLKKKKMQNGNFPFAWRSGLHFWDT